MRWLTFGSVLPASLALGSLLLGPALLGPVTAGAGDARPEGAIRLYQGMLQRNPLDARTYYRLGDAYIQKAREGGDIGFFDLAERALRRALALDPTYAAAARHLAFVLYARHDFEAAARAAEAAIVLDADDAHAHGVLGDALLEVGRYDDAAGAYERMMALGRDLHAYARRAGLRSMRGDVRGAMDDLARAIEEGREAGRPRESVAWAQWQLGNEHFAVGDLGGAETQYSAALATYPGYYRATAGLAQVRAAQGQWAAAIDLFQRSLAVIPLPEVAAALGDVYVAAGRHAEARNQYGLVEYIGRLSALNAVLYNRELAFFYATHDIKVDVALALARRELEVRRDVYAHDVLAWALHKNGRHQEALGEIAAALRLGTRDARLLYHAGMIHEAAGQPEKARAHLREALALNPHFDLLQAPVAARALSRLEPAR